MQPPKPVALPAVTRCTATAASGISSEVRSASRRRITVVFAAEPRNSEVTRVNLQTAAAVAKSGPLIATGSAIDAEESWIATKATYRERLATGGEVIHGVTHGVRSLVPGVATLGHSDVIQ